MPTKKEWKQLRNYSVLIWRVIILRNLRLIIIKNLSGTWAFQDSIQSHFNNSFDWFFYSLWFPNVFLLIPKSYDSSENTWLNIFGSQWNWNNWRLHLPFLSEILDPPITFSEDPYKQSHYESHVHCAYSAIHFHPFFNIFYLFYKYNII